MSKNCDMHDSLYILFPVCLAAVGHHSTVALSCTVICHLCLVIVVPLLACACVPKVQSTTRASVKVAVQVADSRCESRAV